MQCAAADAPLQLVNLTLQVVSPARPQGFLRALVDHAETAASAYTQWPAVRWLVDGVAVPALLQVAHWHTSPGHSVAADAAFS